MQIPLTQGKVAIVDEQDYEYLDQFKWHYKNGYAARSIGRVRVWMQDVIMGQQGVDHIDRDPLNNRRSNLRLASKSLQGHNRSMPSRDLPRGVSLHHGKYQASIRVDGRLIYLGRYSTPGKAKTAYEEACMKYQGELAP